MFAAAGDAEDPLTAFADFGPYRAALSGAMHNSMRDAAQWDRRCPQGTALPSVTAQGARQSSRRDAARNPWRRRSCRAAAWSGSLAVAWMNAQGVTTRAPMAAQPHRVDLRAVLDQKARRFVRPPIEEGASGHVCDSGDQKFARILPYPPPLKSLGAKTIICPIYSGQPLAGPTGWAWNKKSARQAARCRVPRTET